MIKNINVFKEKQDRFSYVQSTPLKVSSFLNDLYFFFFPVSKTYGSASAVLSNKHSSIHLVNVSTFKTYDISYFTSASLTNSIFSSSSKTAALDYWLPFSFSSLISFSVIRCYQLLAFFLSFFGFLLCAICLSSCFVWQNQFITIFSSIRSQFFWVRMTSYNFSGQIRFFL